MIRMKKCAKKPTAAEVAPMSNEARPKRPLAIDCRIRTGGTPLTSPWYVHANVRSSAPARMPPPKTGAIQRCGVPGWVSMTAFMRPPKSRGGMAGLDNGYGTEELQRLRVEYPPITRRFAIRAAPHCPNGATSRAAAQFRQDFRAISAGFRRNLLTRRGCVPRTEAHFRPGRSRHASRYALPQSRRQP